MDQSPLLARIRYTNSGIRAAYGLGRVVTNAKLSGHAAAETSIRIDPSIDGCSGRLHPLVFGSFGMIQLTTKRGEIIADR